MDKKKHTKKIKYAIEQTITVPLHYTEQDIDNYIKSFARERDYMWCEENEQLFDKEI